MTSTVNPIPKSYPVSVPFCPPPTPPSVMHILDPLEEETFTKQPYGDLIAAHRAIGLPYTIGLHINLHPSSRVFDGHSLYKSLSNKWENPLTRKTIHQIYFCAIEPGDSEFHLLTLLEKETPETVGQKTFLNDYFAAINLETTPAIRSNAQALLGDYYHKKKDYSLAVTWYKRAVEQNHSLAQNNLGSCLINGLGISKNEEEGFGWLLKAAEQGLPIAQANLGNCFVQGIGVPKDPEKAAHWYRKAADQDECEAQYQLAECFFKGFGVSKNQEQAAHWFRKAAEQGNCEAQYKLGDCFFNGVGVSKSQEQAAHWFKKAAEQGNCKAQYNLGACLNEGYGVPKNAKEAFDWFLKAAKQGLAIAQYKTGVWLEKGIGGVSQNLEEAIRWYEQASAQGYDPAQQKLSELKK